MNLQEGIGHVLSVNFPYEERLYPSVYDQAKVWKFD